MIVGLWITKFCTRLAHLSQLRLDFHDVLHLLRGHALAETKQLEHLNYVLLKCLTNISCCLVIVEVILFQAQREATLINVQDILSGILIICSKACKEELLLAVGSKFKLDIKQLFVGLSCLQTLNQRHDRSHALVVTTRRVHGQLIEVAKLLLNRAFLVGVTLEFGKNTIDTLVIILLQLVEAAIA